MKKTLNILVLVLVTTISFAQVGIGTKTPHASAILEVTGGDATVKKGFLPPRVTTAQRNAIASPPAGLVVYNTTENRPEFSNGTNWINLTDGSLIIAINGATNTGSGGVGIGTNTPNRASILDLTSTVKGFLPPRMNTANRNMIASPAVGLMIYNTDVNCLQWHRGANIWHNSCGDNLYTQYPQGSNFCNVQPTAIVEVLNVHTGKIWMDRNLGASRAATSRTDAEAFGSLYQWGRRSDGHQCVNRFSGDGVTTSTNTVVGATVDTDTPPHGDFIRVSSGNNDWRSPKNDNLWQGVNGVNNPCPSGFRVPTDVELNNERLSWVIAPISSTNDSNGAFASPLRIPLAGLRGSSGGTVSSTGNGFYWSSTVATNFARSLDIGPFSAGINPLGQSRGQGYSVRCIKN